GVYQIYEDMAGSSDLSTDSDGDGWDDWTEWLYAGNATMVDANDTPDDDGDGLYQYYEDTAGSSDLDADTDGDGWDDWTEWVNGTDLTDPASHS
ncbi:MAG TPA: hypothetical protein PKW90_12265, partial [Myxococcota bacterium]|nr:hypothetical protein [Myxococcota bacterium]